MKQNTLTIKELSSIQSREEYGDEFQYVDEWINLNDADAIVSHAGFIDQLNQDGVEVTLNNLLIAMGDIFCREGFQFRSTLKPTEIYTSKNLKSKKNYKRIMKMLDK